MGGTFAPDVRADTTSSKAFFQGRFAQWPAPAPGHGQGERCSVEVTTNSDCSREQFAVSQDKGPSLAQAGHKPPLAFGFPCHMKCFIQAPQIQAETQIHAALPSPLPAPES